MQPSDRILNGCKTKNYGADANTSKLSVFSSVGCAMRTVKILTCWDFGAHGAPYYDTYSP